MKLHTRIATSLALLAFGLPQVWSAEDPVAPPDWKAAESPVYRGPDDDWAKDPSVIQAGSVLSFMWACASTPRHDSGGGDRVHCMFAAALYDGPLADAVQAADPKLLYPAIQVVSRDAGGMARGKLGSFFDRRLKLEDVIALAPDIKAIETATTQPELRSIPALPGNGVKK